LQLKLKCKIEIKAEMQPAADIWMPCKEQINVQNRTKNHTNWNIELLLLAWGPDLAPKSTTPNLLLENRFMAFAK